MDKPRITIGIPCYNQAQYLVDAVESVLSQTYKPHEIIICNDGSPDDTRYVALQYPEVKYIEQVNKGLASARNTIIMNSSPNTDFILFLDSDDMMTENCLQRIIDTIAYNPDADIIAPSFKEFGARDTTIILMEKPEFEDFKPVNGFPMNRIGYFSAVKKESLLEIGGYSPKMTWGWEDYHLWLNLASRGKKIVTIPEVLILYRVKEKSMITEANAHATELWTQIYKDFPNLNG